MDIDMGDICTHVPIRIQADRTMEAEKSPNLPPASWSSQESCGIIQSRPKD